MKRSKTFINKIVYESFKIHHRETYNRQPNPIERICYGAIAGILGQTASYPFDVI